MQCITAPFRLTEFAPPQRRESIEIRFCAKRSVAAPPVAGQGAEYSETSSHKKAGCSASGLFM